MMTPDMNFLYSFVRPFIRSFHMYRGGWWVVGDVLTVNLNEAVWESLFLGGRDYFHGNGIYG
jgi:hypothetical protein